MYPVAIYELLEQVISNLALKSPQDASRLADNKQMIILLLAVWQIGYMIVVFIFSIFFSHRIAGPLYKLTTFLKNGRKGGKPATLFFRKNDYFKEIADEYNITMDSIYQNYAADFDYLNEVDMYISNLAHALPEDKKPVIEEIHDNITKMKKRYETNSVHSENISE
jgi:predicted DNA-binding protein YlxM (UPF0122 family)